MTMFGELDLITPREPFGALEWDILPGATFAGLTNAEQKAIAITSSLETGRPGGFDGLTGNFDGMGISFGLVNWNIGAGSLQPLLRDFARDFPARWKAVFGPDADRFLALIGPKDEASTKAQLAFAKTEMNEVRKVLKKKKLVDAWVVKEPWATYFHRLAADPEFQKIEVRYVRNLLGHARGYCERFGLKSERAFCFMFDAVSSHGPWWLTKKRKSDRVEWRRVMLESKLTALKIQGRTSERDILNAVAETLRDTSLDKYKTAVFVRKQWFLGGPAPRNADVLAKLVPTDAPYTSGGAISGTTAPTPPPPPAPTPRPAVDPVLDVAVISAFLQGIRNTGDITDAVFLQRHPERKGARIGANEAGAAAEWRRIRDRVRQLFPKLDAHTEMELELSPAVEDAAVTPVVLIQIAAGERDPNKLANEAFFALNRDRGRKPIARTDKVAARQWSRLRSGIVARLLGGAAPTKGVTAPADTTIAGTTHYVSIDLGHSGQAAPLTGIYVPEGFRPGADVDVILFLHGHKTGYEGGSKMAIDRYWSPATKPAAPLREAVRDSGKNVILVAPTLGLRSEVSGLLESNALDGYLDRVLRELASTSSWQGRATPRLRHLVLSAHSGGGIGMLKIVQRADKAIQNNLRECWGYDCFYNPGADKPGWPKWARENPDKTMFGYYATEGSTKDPRVKIGPTSTAKYFEGLRIPNLRMIPSKVKNHFAPLALHVAERITGAAFLERR